VIVDSRLGCLDVNGLPVGIGSHALAQTPESLPTVLLLHGRDGPDGMAGDRGYRDIAAALAGAGFRVVLPRYFERTRPLEAVADEPELDAVGREIERYGLWLGVVGEVLRREAGMGRPVGLMGYSPGGYQALTAAMAWRGAAALVVCYAGARHRSPVWRPTSRPP
jgi:dienelactone hydrolase